jgi:hypothetical protein
MVTPVQKGLIPTYSTVATLNRSTMNGNLRPEGVNTNTYLQYCSYTKYTPRSTMNKQSRLSLRENQRDDKHVTFK